VATTPGVRPEGWSSALVGWTDFDLGPSGTHPIGNVRHFVQLRPALCRLDPKSDVRPEVLSVPSWPAPHPPIPQGGHVLSEGLRVPREVLHVPGGGAPRRNDGTVSGEFCHGRPDG